jgi:transposase
VGEARFGDPLAHADQLDARIVEYDHAIAQAARDDARSKRLMQRPGIGPVTASALVASIGCGHDFKNGRQVAAWIGSHWGIQQRRQGSPGADRQGRRPLPAQSPGYGRASRSR